MAIRYTHGYDGKVMSSVSREEFPEQVARIVEAKFPLVKVVPDAVNFAVRLNDHVASLENLYRIVAYQPGEVQHQVERWVVELLRAGEGRPDQRGSFQSLRDRIYPMVLPTSGSELPNESAVTQPLVAGLVVAYAIDSDRTITYIPRPLFEGWNISVDDLHEAAISNLVTHSASMQAHAAQDEEGNTNLILVQTLDGYDASRILLPSLHEQLKQHLGSPFLAGIPNRDILICFRNEPAMAAKLAAQIGEDFKTMPHQLTDKLFLVTADGIAPFVALAEG